MNIDKILNRWGRSIFLSCSDGWKSPLFKAFIQPLRYKTKLYLTGTHTPIGINSNDVYLYIGPPNHDLTRLDKTYRINDSDKIKYTVDRAEKIFAGDRAVYVWAVIRKTTEAEI